MLSTADEGGGRAEAHPIPVASSVELLRLAPEPPTPCRCRLDTTVRPHGARTGGVATAVLAEET